MLWNTVLQRMVTHCVDWGFLRAGQDPDVVRDPAYLIPFPRQVLVLNTDLSQPWIPSSYC